MEAVLLAFLIAAPARAAEPAVAPSTGTQNLLEQAIQNVGDTFKKGTDKLGEGAKALGEGAKKLGEGAARQAQGFTRSLRRMAIEIGSGVDTGKDIIDPFVPKGIDRLFEFDTRLLVRNEGLRLRAKYRDPPYFKQMSLDYSLKFDPFQGVGLGPTRDHLYRGLGLAKPGTQYGYGLALSGVKSEYWGATFGYDKTRTRDGSDLTVDQTTALGGGWSPLGGNNGKVWNWSLVGAVNWRDVSETVAGVHTLKHGPGFSFGPVYQYALDWVPIPYTEKIGWERKAKLDRFKTFVSYSDSQIGPEAFTVGADVAAYATKALRLSVGAEQTFLPGPEKGRFQLKFGVSLLLNLLDFKF